MRFTYNARKGKCLARHVLPSAETLVLLFYTVRKPVLARVVRENFTRWGRGTCLTLTTAPEYFRTLTQGGLRSRLASDLYNVGSILLLS